MEKAEPRVIDFTNVTRTYDREHHKVTPEQDAKNWEEYQKILTAIRGGRDDFHPYPFVSDRVNGHTRVVPAFRMKRARRILWECQQRPEWPERQGSFFRHPSLKNIPYVVMKRLVQESERRDV